MSFTSGAGGFLGGFNNSFFPGMRANDQMELQRQQDARKQALVDQQMSAYQKAQQTEAANRMLATNPALLQQITAEVPQGYLNQDLQTVKDNASPGFMMQMRNYRTPEQEMADSLNVYKGKKIIDSRFSQPSAANIKMITMDGPEGPGQYAYNMDTGQAKKVGGVVADKKDTAPDFKGEQQLRKEFQQEQKIFKTAKYQWGVIQSSASKPGPAGDIGLIFGIMKMFDPGSVVRESEFAVAAGAGSLYERAKAQAARVSKGERLSAEQRADFVETAKRIYDGVLSEYRHKEKFYTSIANQYGMDPKRIVYDYGWEPAQDTADQGEEKKTETNVKPTLSEEADRLIKEAQNGR